LGTPATRHSHDLAGPDDAQICRSIKDPKQNKNRNLDHWWNTSPKTNLVMWGWNPGEGRTPIPMPHEEFAAKVKQWQAAGATCRRRPVSGQTLDVPGRWNSG